MPSIRDHISKALFYNTRGSTQMVPGEILVANCRTGGFEEAAAREALADLVEAGELCEAAGQYARATPPDAGRLDLATHRGDESTPWQFSLEREPDRLVVRQARGPPDQADPVVTRFAIEDQPVGTDPVEFHHALARRVWTEAPELSLGQSHRREGHVVEFLYRDPDGRHLARPEAAGDASDGDGFAATDLPGITVSSTFLRSEEGDDVRQTDERTYRVTRDVFDAHAEVYVLSYDEVDEESVTGAVWETENATAHRLVPDST
jgi:hypothetical protein